MVQNVHENRQRLYEIADAQGGYFTAAQAVSAGYAYSQQHFHRNSGAWLTVGRGLFRLRAYPDGDREDLIRWSLWSHNRAGVPQAVVSHESALTVHGLSDVMPANIHLTVPSTFRKRVPPGCVLHQDHLKPGDWEERLGYRVTTPLRTLVDGAEGTLSQEHLDRAVQDDLALGLVQRQALASASCSVQARQRLDQAMQYAKLMQEL